MTKRRNKAVSTRVTLMPITQQWSRMGGKSRLRDSLLSSELSRKLRSFVGHPVSLRMVP